MEMFYTESLLMNPSVYYLMRTELYKKLIAFSIFHPLPTHLLDENGRLVLIESISKAFILETILRYAILLNVNLFFLFVESQCVS